MANDATCESQSAVVTGSRKLERTRSTMRGNGNSRATTLLASPRTPKSSFETMISTRISLHFFACYLWACRRKSPSGKQLLSWCFLLFFSALASACWAQDKVESSGTVQAAGETAEILDVGLSEEESTAAFNFPNLRTPTLGGKQFWTDHLWRQGWRVQQNALTGSWRLLDPKNVRHAWGSRAGCVEALNQLVPENTLPTQHSVIMLHGLMRSASSMGALSELLAKQPEFSVVAFEYASARYPIGEHAQALRNVLDGLPPQAQLSFVGHSMGNIVVRHLIGDLIRANDTAMLERIRHVVMVGPPNQGSSIARQLSKTGLFGWVTGQGGLELGPGWESFEAHLAVPHCPFGIVAGRLPDTTVVNPLVDGAGDFVVSVEETKLEGAADFLEVPRLHSFLMDDPAVQSAVVQFLKTNRFTAP